MTKIIDPITFLQQCMGSQLGVEQWNRWREEADFEHLALHNFTCEGQNVSNINLSNCSFDRSVIIDSTFENVNLSGSILMLGVFQSCNIKKSDLKNAQVHYSILVGTHIIESDLSNAVFISSNLGGATFEYSNLTNADFGNCECSGASFVNAVINNTSFFGANLTNCDFSGLGISNSNFGESVMVRTNLTGAIIDNCEIYGLSVWDLKTNGLRQNNLKITPYGQSSITVDNLEVAQFIYLLLNNPKIRDVIDTVAKKAVLILGRFTPERKSILDAIKNELRKCDYVPIIFDFEKPESQNLRETVSTLAHISCFIIADVTSPNSVAMELEAIAPRLRKPIQAIFQPTEEQDRVFAMFNSLEYDWVLPLQTYDDKESLISSINEKIITPAQNKIIELAKKKKD